MANSVTIKYEPVNPEKYCGTYPIVLRSSWEITAARTFDNHPGILHWASEPCKIPYINPFTNKQTVYIPDFFVVYEDAKGKRHHELMEVKPLEESTMESARTKKHKLSVTLNKVKWAVASAWAKQHGMTFRVITQDNLYRNHKK